jgi:hypothetical protein
MDTQKQALVSLMGLWTLQEILKSDWLQWYQKRQFTQENQAFVVSVDR